MTGMLEVDDSAVVLTEPRDGWGERPLIVLLHGRGSHEHDLMQLAPLLLPEAVSAALRAPLPFPGGGYTWFPSGAPGVPPGDGVDAATRAILAWLDRAAPAGPVAVVGFSQGGALATRLMRTAPERFAAFVNLSGFVTPEPGEADDRLGELQPPMFWGRDVADPVIPAVATDLTEAWLPAHCALTRRRYDGIGHGISMEEIEDVREFLRPLLLPGH